MLSVTMVMPSVTMIMPSVTMVMPPRVSNVLERRITWLRTVREDDRIRWVFVMAAKAADTGPFHGHRDQAIRNQTLSVLKGKNDVFHMKPSRICVTQNALRSDE